MTTPAPIAASIPVAKIRPWAETRLRQADAAKVGAIAHSYGLVGQLQPIRVVSEGDDFLLVAGLHRLLAAKQVGWTKIDALVTPAGEIDADQQRLVEIFENLIRAELSALDRAVNLAELKVVHERLHPDAKHGGDRRSKGAKAKGAADQVPIFGFRSDVAAKTGLSPSLIGLSVAIANGLSSGIRARLQGTWLADHQAGLKALSEQPEKTQRQVLDILFATPPGATSVGDALVLASGQRLPNPAEARFRSLSDGVARLTAKDRAKLYALHEDEILQWAKKRLARVS